MSVSVTVNGVSYTIPTQSERGWASAVTSWIQSVSSNTLQKNGGTFTLTADANFGATYGLLGAYFSTRTALPSTAGIFRLSNTESIGWRNAANSANLLLTVNASDQLTYNGVAIASSSGVVPITAGGTNITSYTTGDTLYASATNVLSKLAAGTNGQFLTLAAGVPAWATVVTDPTNATNLLAGQVFS